MCAVHLLHRPVRILRHSAPAARADTVNRRSAKSRPSHRRSQAIRDECTAATRRNSDSVIAIGPLVESSVTRGFAMLAEIRTSIALPILTLTIVVFTAPPAPAQSRPVTTVDAKEFPVEGKVDPRNYQFHFRLAELHEARGNWASALSHYKKALKFQQAALGPQHPDVAPTYDRIAALHLRGFDPGHLESYQSCLGPYDLESAQFSPPCQTVNRWVPAHGPNYSSAITAMREALAIRRRAWGSDSPLLVPYLLKSCHVQKAARKLKLAQAAVAEARRIAGVSQPASPGPSSKAVTCTL